MALMGTLPVNIVEMNFKINKDIFCLLCPSLILGIELENAI